VAEVLALAAPPPISCGIPELDAACFGEVLFTIGKYSIYQQETRTVVTEPSVRWDQLYEYLTLTDGGGLHTTLQNIILTCNFEGTTQEAFNQLKLILPNYPLCVGKMVLGTLIVFVRRTDRKKWPEVQLVDSDGMVTTPLVYKLKNMGRGTKNLETGFQLMSAVMASCTTQLAIRSPSSGSYSFDEFLAATRCMTQLQLLKVKGIINVKPKKTLTEFDTTFLRCLGDITRYRELSRASKCEIINAYTYHETNPSMKICPPQLLRNLGQTGTRLKPIDLLEETFTLRQVLSDRKVAQQTGIILLGGNRTTGFGKTQFALRCAVEHAMAWCESCDLPRDEANILITNTIDSANTADFSKIMVWILDEFSPADKETQCYASEDLLKCLLTTNLAADLRGRNHNVKVPAGVLRIMTSNAENGQEWCGPKIKWSEPLRRRSLVFKLTGGRPLVAHEWWKSPLVTGSAVGGSEQSEASAARASAILEARALLIPADEPVAPPVAPRSVLSSLICPHRPVVHHV
jgi:hypothetical protein